MCTRNILTAASVPQSIKLQEATAQQALEREARKQQQGMASRNLAVR
jgi:hypothetical protein